MARTGISSHMPKSTSYPPSGYSTSYSAYGSGSGSAYPSSRFSSYNNPSSSSRFRESSITRNSTSRPLGGSTTSPSSYSSNRSTYNLPSSYEPSKRFGTYDRSRRDISASPSLLRPSQPLRALYTSQYETSRNNYNSGSGSASYGSGSGSGSTSYGSGSAYQSDYGRRYGGRMMSEERSLVSEELQDLSLNGGGQRLLPPLKKSTSTYDLSSARDSIASSGRPSTERETNGRIGGEPEDGVVAAPRSVFVSRNHPTMGTYASSTAAERRLGGSCETESAPTKTTTTTERGKTERELADVVASYASRHVGRSSTVVRRESNDEREQRETSKRFPSVDTTRNLSTSSRKNSIVSRSCTGLRNIGNTCFMNSVLQCLAHTKPLLDHCLTSEYESDINREASRMKGVLVCAYADLMSTMWSGQETVVSPTNFKCEVSRFAKLFLGYNQQDAQEFLMYLLQGIHEDLNRIKEKKKSKFIDDSNEVETISARDKSRKSWKEHLEVDNSKIVDLFEGQLKSVLTCTECGYVSNTFDPALGLSLPIKKSYSSSVSLLDCLELFTQEEVLDGNEKTMCARCKRNQKSTKKLSIQKFPQILIINLKRFNDESYYRSKLSTEVKCPIKNLDLTTFSEERMAERVVYDLYAVSNHSGTPSGGHYTASARNPFTMQWNYYNDHRVSAISESDIITSEAYILFYELSSSSRAADD